MSQYQLESQKHDICVGWDEPRKSFFAIIRNADISKDSDKQSIIAWIGNGYDSIKSIKRLQELISPFGTIPKDIATKLQHNYK